MLSGVNSVRYMHTYIDTYSGVLWTPSSATTYKCMKLMSIYYMVLLSLTSLCIFYSENPSLLSPPCLLLHGLIKISFPYNFCCRRMSTCSPGHRQIYMYALPGHAGDHNHTHACSFTLFTTTQGIYSTHHANRLLLQDTPIPYTTEYHVPRWSHAVKL